MPPPSDAAWGKKKAVDGGADRLSALSDDALRRVLSFLPSSEAVRTCTLTRRWGRLWRSAPSLRVTNPRRFGTAGDLNGFVNSLLLLRDRAPPLREVEISFYREADDDTDEAFRYIELWVRYALSAEVSEVRLLRIRNGNTERWPMPNGLITSRNLEKLAKLELVGVQSGTGDHSLDFSRCPALENLNMKSCRIHVNRIVSTSVKHLSITDCILNDRDRVHISTPGLMSFELADCGGWTPSLESMPSLELAFVRLQECEDCCFNAYDKGYCEDDDCEGCFHRHEENNSCLLLEGLSCCTNLELTAEQGVFVFRDDLTECPVFCNLKTLLLNEWCITANFEDLTCLLQNSPILEKLAIQFEKIPAKSMENDASDDLEDEPIASKQLSVEVKCREVDEQICEILKFLGSDGIAREINIQLSNTCWSSKSFSFEQKKLGH